MIIGLFVTISFLLAGIIYLQGNVFAGVRAYVRGEGLWANAQKDAVLYLTRYTYNYDDADYHDYLNAISIILGDKHARTALLQSPPNLIQARDGFLRGNNDPRDVDAMIWFFLNFKTAKYMHNAITIWGNGDNKIDELRHVGEEIRQEIEYAGHRPGELLKLRELLRQLNMELLALENQFSTVLGNGARWVKHTVWTVSIIVLLIFVGIAVFISAQIIRSITSSESELIESETRFRSLKESNTIGILSWHKDGTISDANAFFFRMLGYPDDAFLPQQLNWRNLTPLEYQHLDEQALQELKQYGRCQPYEKALYHQNGKQVPVLFGASLLSSHNDQGMAFVVDLRERKKTEEQLKLAATVLASSRDGIVITDSASKIITANRSFCDMTGFTEQELLGTPLNLLQPTNTTPEQLLNIKRTLDNKGHWQGNMSELHKNGTILPLRVSISTVKDNNNQPTHFVAILSDNSQQKAQEDYLRHVALHDPLTELPNRVLFYDRFAQSIKYARRNHSKFAILYFDLNNFKQINDQYGHALGDKLLQIIGRRLMEHIRTTDTVTRLGGDEFVILLDNITDRKSVEDMLDKMTQSVCAPCDIEGVTLQPGVSVGVAIYPENGRDEKSLIHHADLAMYEMKNAVTNRARRSN